MNADPDADPDPQHWHLSSLLAAGIIVNGSVQYLSALYSPWKSLLNCTGTVPYLYFSLIDGIINLFCTVPPLPAETFLLGINF